MAIKFGTDGWRAIIAEEFTFENVSLCVQGVASYVAELGWADRGVVVGFDTRFGSRDFARCAAETLAANSVPALLCVEACPTPVVSYSVPKLGAAGAVMITASHNPPEWNGVKFKPEYGGSASSEIVVRLEEHVAAAEAAGARRMGLEEAVALELAREFDPAPEYMSQMARMVDLDVIRGAGINVLVDAMHGAGAGYLPRLMEGSTGAVKEIRGEVNPSFPGMHQPEPIAENLSQASAMLSGGGFDVGIAYDGDADRLGVLDENGRYFNTLQVFALLALYLLEVKGERGPIVKSITSSDMLFRLGELYDVPVLETGVGFKYAGPLMMKENAWMGGEESGGYGFRGHIPERDGILSSLLFLEFMARTGKRPSELLSMLYERVGEWSYGRRDVPFDVGKRGEFQEALAKSADVGEIGGMRVVSTDATDGRRFRFDKGWVMVRLSGTEPLVRIYAEAESEEVVEALVRGASGMLGVIA